MRIRENGKEDLFLRNEKKQMKKTNRLFLVLLRFLKNSMIAGLKYAFDKYQKENNLESKKN
jgi:hypothetical protein